MPLQLATRRQIQHSLRGIIWKSLKAVHRGINAGKMRGCTYLEWKENHHRNTAARRGPRIPLEEAGAIAVSQTTATLARPGDKKQQKDKYNF